MTRAIDRLRDRPEELPQVPLEVRRFLVPVLYTIAFAPDRESTATSRRLRMEFEQYFGSAAAVEEALEREFFEQLYVDRPERGEIESLIPTERVILVYGLTGAGKTVLLNQVKRKLQSSGAIEFMMFDLKAATELLGPEADTDEEFSERFERFVYTKLYDEYLSKSDDLVSEWLVYKVRVDPGYAAFREWVQDRVRRSLSSREEWYEVLIQDRVDEELSQCDVRAQLATLLLFLKSKFPLALCFDNVDRHPIRFQRQILSSGIDYSNRVQVPIVISIRESNLRRVRAEGALGDIVFSSFLEPIKGSYGKEVRLREVSEASFQELLKRRMSFVQRYDAFGTFDPFFRQFEEAHGLSFAEFSGHFWSLFETLSEAFVERGVYHYCNTNIREVLMLYYRLISKILLYPEGNYGTKDLLLSEERARRTQLRNYLYKWLICGDQVVPPSNDGLVNIFERRGSAVQMLDLKILEYIYNWGKRHPGERLSFGRISKVFKRFGVGAKEVAWHITEMTSNQGLSELGFVWVDRRMTNTIRDNTAIYLLPAGEYFVEKLSVAREYAFWNALGADLSIDLLGRSFTMSETYEDGFKLDVVLSLVEKVLLPDFQAELERVDKEAELPPSWHGSKLGYYKSCFTIRGHFYPLRLIQSVQETLPYAEIRAEERTAYRDRFEKMWQAFVELEQLVEN